MSEPFDPIQLWATLLQSFRRLHRLTQEGLAEELGVTAQTVSRWESGRQAPDPQSQKRLGALLGTASMTTLDHWVERVRRSHGTEFFVDETLKIRAASVSVFDRTGVMPSDYEGRNLRDFIPGSDKRFANQLFDTGFFLGRVRAIQFMAVFHIGSTSIGRKIDAWPVALADAQIYAHMQIYHFAVEQKLGLERLDVLENRVILVEDSV